MSELKDWINAHCPGIRKGQTVYIVSVKGNSRIGNLELKAETIKSIGRSYITLDNWDQTRFSVCDQKQNSLVQDASTGYASLLFTDQSAAEAYIEKDRLLLEFRKNAQSWAESTSLGRLKAACRILSREASSESVRLFLGNDAARCDCD